MIFSYVELKLNEVKSAFFRTLEIKHLYQKLNNI